MIRMWFPTLSLHWEHPITKARRKMEHEKESRLPAPVKKKNKKQNKKSRCQTPNKS